MHHHAGAQPGFSDARSVTPAENTLSTPGQAYALSKIVSGGQTGVDRAALDAALENDFPCGGYCPKGRKAEDGMIPIRYPLQEHGSTKYAGRTHANVLLGQGTLIIFVQKLEGGTALAKDYCLQLGKTDGFSQCRATDIRTGSGEGPGPYPEIQDQFPECSGTPPQRVDPWLPVRLSMCRPHNQGLHTVHTRMTQETGTSQRCEHVTPARNFDTSFCPGTCCGKATR